MSLRIFHILFVIVCVGFSASVAIWCFRDYAAERSPMALALGILFVVSGVALVVYGTKVYAKLRDLP